VYRVLRHFEHQDSAIPKNPMIVVDEYQDFSLLETSSSPFSRCAALS
jgi:hypothetical protein